MAALTDPILMSYVEEFETGIDALKETAGKDHHKVAKRLCELSRDIRFQLGLPEKAPKELVERIIAAFGRAADAIAVDKGEPLNSVFQEHIRERMHRVTAALRNEMIAS
jgi:hypothetical protein